MLETEHPTVTKERSEVVVARVREGFTVKDRSRAARYNHLGDDHVRQPFHQLNGTIQQCFIKMPCTIPVQRSRLCGQPAREDGVPGKSLIPLSMNNARPFQSFLIE